MINPVLGFIWTVYQNMPEGNKNIMNIHFQILHYKPLETPGDIPHSQSSTGTCIMKLAENIPFRQY